MREISVVTSSFSVSDNVWSEYTMSPGGSNEINESVEYIQVCM